MIEERAFRPSTGPGFVTSLALSDFSDQSHGWFDVTWEFSRPGFRCHRRAVHRFTVTLCLMPESQSRWNK